MKGDAINMYPGACAACRHQRKRCDANCQLAQYFPASKIEDFKNVYRLFGVNNTLKILNSVPVNERDKTVETLILEAKMRRDYPVLGSLHVERNLRAEIETYQKELDEVNKKLNFFREVTKLQQEKQDLESELDKTLIDLCLPSLQQDVGSSTSTTASLPMAQFGSTSMVQPFDAHHDKGYTDWFTMEETAKDEIA